MMSTTVSFPSVETKVIKPVGDEDRVKVVGEGV
jgi:hypothetical protein